MGQHRGLDWNRLCSITDTANARAARHAPDLRSYRSTVVPHYRSPTALFLGEVRVVLLGVRIGPSSRRTGLDGLWRARTLRHHAVEFVYDIFGTVRGDFVSNLGRSRFVLKLFDEGFLRSSGRGGLSVYGRASRGRRCELLLANAKRAEAA
jgi:hypothetical protein